jgi:hypothetical protein
MSIDLATGPWWTGSAQASPWCGAASRIGPGPRRGSLTPPRPAVGSCAAPFMAHSHQSRRSYLQSLGSQALVDLSDCCCFRSLPRLGVSWWIRSCLSGRWLSRRYRWIHRSWRCGPCQGRCEGASASRINDDQVGKHQRVGGISPSSALSAALCVHISDQVTGRGIYSTPLVSPEGIVAVLLEGISLPLTHTDR